MRALYPHAIFRLCRATLFLAVLVAAGCTSAEQRAQMHYERGVSLMAQHDYAKASIELKNALQLKKDMVEAWRALAKIEETNRDWPSLLAIRRTIVELDPKDVEAKLKLAVLMVNGNALDEALTLANAALDLDNKNAAALAFKAAVLLKLNDVQGAARQARAALDIDGNNTIATVVLAAERLDAGDVDAAMTILDREAAAHPGDLGIQLLNIKVLEKAGKSEQVEAVLRKLVGLYPNEMGFRRHLVVHYAARNRLGEAESELRAIAAANPDDVQAELELVRFLRLVKGPEAARRELVSRIGADANAAFPYRIALADFDFARGDIAVSVQLLENLIAAAESSEHKLAGQVKLAEIELATRNLGAAEALVAKILRDDKRNTAGLRLRASLRLERGLLDGAIADARQALNDQPRSTELMLLLAAAYERGGSIALAEKEFADAARASGFDAEVAIQYVSFLRRRGRIARAEDVLTELAGRWPGNVGILSALAEVRLARQNWIGAEAIAERIRRIRPEAIRADAIAAAALSGRGRYDESIGLLQNAYSADPGAIPSMVALVNTLVRADKLDRAVAFLEGVLQANPENAEAHTLLGSVRLLQRAPDKALQSFQAAIERQPKKIVGYQALADFYVRANDIGSAEATIRAALQQQPDSFIMHLALADVLELQEDHEAAIAEYESMLNLQQESMVVANNLASLLAEHRSDKASLERAYALATRLQGSEIPSFKDTLGWVYHLRGDDRSALPLLEEAAAKLPERPLIQYHLGMTHLAAGQRAEAVKHLDMAGQSAPLGSDLMTKIEIAQQKAAD